MEFNFLIVLLSALIPILVGFVYYHPKTLGNPWMKANGLTEESMKGANMGIIMGASLLLSVVISFFLSMLVVHQTDVFSLFADGEMLKDVNSQEAIVVNQLLELTGDKFLTFKHGSFHGILIGLFFVFPIIAINNLFERKPFKLSLIHAGYWAITLGLMGGVLCQWGFKAFHVG
mgnify:CR=1 FL=1